MPVFFKPPHPVQQLDLPFTIIGDLPCLQTEVIFVDWDGVFADTLFDSLRYAKEVQMNLGRGRTPELSDFQNADPLTFPEIARRIGLQGNDIELFTRRVFALQNAETKIPDLFLGAEKALQGLAAIAKVVVVTASAEKIVRAASRKRGGEECITAVLDGTSGLSKAERIRAYLEDNSIDARNAFMIGDSASDIASGHSANVPTIAALWGFQSPEFLASKSPTAKAHSPLSLPDMVCRLDIASHYLIPPPLLITNPFTLFIDDLFRLNSFLRGAAVCRPSFLRECPINFEGESKPLNHFLRRVIDTLNDCFKANKTASADELRCAVESTLHSLGEIHPLQLIGIFEARVEVPEQWQTPPKEVLAFERYLTTSLGALISS